MMSRIRLEPPLLPKNGKALKALVITRVSSNIQGPVSLPDRQASIQRWLEDRYDGPVESVQNSGQGSGECFDRQQVREAEDLIATGQFDVVILEDLARYARRAQVLTFCRFCAG